jgi:hypothetical protein
MRDRQCVIGRSVSSAFLALTFISTGALASPADVRTQALCDYRGYRPTAVTVGSRPVVAHFALTSSSCTFWSIEITSASVYVYTDSPDESFDPELLNEGDAGRHTAVVQYCDAAYSCEKTTDAFSLRKATSFGSTFNAAPEPVRKDATIRMTARLSRVRWGYLWDERGRYVPYAPKNGVAVIQFQPVNGRFRDFKTVPVGKGGVVNGAVVAKADGAWRYRFPGNVSTAPTFSKPDYVDVK